MYEQNTLLHQLNGEIYQLTAPPVYHVQTQTEPIQIFIRVPSPYLLVAALLTVAVLLASTLSSLMALSV